MTTIVVVTPASAPSVVLFDDTKTTILMPSAGSQSVVLSQELQTVIFNSEGPPGPNSSYSDPGDLAAIYQQSKG